MISYNELNILTKYVQIEIQGSCSRDLDSYFWLLAPHHHLLVMNQQASQIKAPEHYKCSRNGHFKW